MYLSGDCRLMYRPTSRSTVDQYTGRYAGRYSVQSRVVFCCHSRIGRQIDQQSVEIASVVCRQYIDELSVEYQ